MKQYFKFGESCCYSHDVSKPKNDELLEELKEDLENIKQKNRKLEAKNSDLDKTNKALKKEVQNKSEALAHLKQQQEELEI